MFVVGSLCAAALTVQPAFARTLGLVSTSTSLGLSSNPPTLGQQVTLTATVSSSGGTPTGTVSFTDGTTTLGTATLSGGTATLTTTFAAGHHDLSATYATHYDPVSHNTFTTSTSSTTSFDIVSASKHGTTLALQSSASNLSTTQSATLTATIADQVDGTDYPVGTVRFEDNGVLLATVDLHSADKGVATTQATGFVAGDNVITAAYTPGTVDGVTDTTHNGSSGSTTISATAPAVAVTTSITASVSPNPIVAGGSATLSAHVEQVGTKIAPPQGSIVTFRNAADGSLIGQATLDGSGNGSVTTYGWHAGSYKITATYVGDANNASSSTSFVATVGQIGQVTITAPSPTIVYGDATPGLTPTYSGFVGGDGPSSLTTQPTCTTNATGTKPAAGTYTVTCSGASDPSYTFAYVSGTMTVQQAPLAITPDNLTMTQGDLVPHLTATIAGFVDGETLATSDVTGSPACTTTATTTSPVGTYPITCTVGTLSSNDYSFAVVGQGTLTISTTGTTETTSIAWVGGPILAGHPVTLVGSLFSHWTSLSGKTVTLTLGSASCTATTNWSGFASCSVTPAGPLGPTTSTASFEGDAAYTASTGSRGAILYAFPSGGGAFVVGDQSSAASTSVTFWGSQWWKQNEVSQGSASHSFEGFASSPSVPTIDGTWSTGTGDSSSPPSTIPSYLGVIVTDSTSQSGSTISGTVCNIAVVQTDSGYRPDPGHAGTGTIVGSLFTLAPCSSSGDNGNGRRGGHGGYGGHGSDGSSSSPNDYAYKYGAGYSSESHRSQSGYTTRPAL